MFRLELPNPFSLDDGQNIFVEEFETFEEALEWASEFLDVDEDGKLQIIKDTEEVDSEEIWS